MGWLTGLFLGLIIMCLAKDSLVMLMVCVEVMTALVVTFSCVTGASAILAVGGMLVCGSSLMLAGLIMSL